MRKSGGWEGRAGGAGSEDPADHLRADRMVLAGLVALHQGDLMMVKDLRTDEAVVVVPEAPGDLMTLAGRADHRPEGRMTVKGLPGGGVDAGDLAGLLRVDPVVAAGWPRMWRWEKVPKASMSLPMAKRCGRPIRMTARFR